MAFTAYVRRLLISCPGDVPQEDLAIVRKAINFWNGLYGPDYASIVIPISWGEHAAAEFGQHPQDSLNAQIVDQCDICLAIFANRLGTPTSTAESGTAEEIERLHLAGKYVAILKCRRSVDPDKIDLDQRKKLLNYLQENRERSLTLDYVDDATLERHVYTILATLVTRDRAASERRIEEASQGRDEQNNTRAEVWPRIESNGDRDHLVLVNTGDEVARAVKVTLGMASDQGSPWTILGYDSEEDPAFDLAPSHGEVRFRIITAFGVATQMTCTVTWSDHRGSHTNSTTLRLF